MRIEYDLIIYIFYLPISHLYLKVSAAGSKFTTMIFLLNTSAISCRA